MHKSLNLELVSITGADNRTDISELRCMALRFPFVEWAVLYGAKPGTPRNPDSAWREAFFGIDMPCSKAVHLCGSEAFVDLLKGALPKELRQAGRLQLNINARRTEFSHGEVLSVYRSALAQWPSVILQLHETTRAPILDFLSGLSQADFARTHILLDESRGKGIAPSEHTIPQGIEASFCGFAGGLGPDNTSAVLPELLRTGRRLWIDMESGVRTDNNLDLAKVRRVLEAAGAAR